MFHKTICFEKKSHLFYMNIGKKKKKRLSHCLIFLMYKKALFSAMGSIFSNGHRFNKTERPVHCVKFDKDLSPDLCLRNRKKIMYMAFLCWSVWVII